MADDMNKDIKLDEEVLKHLNDMRDMLDKRLTAIEDMLDSVRTKVDILESDNTAERNKGENKKRLKFRDGKYIEE